MFELFSQCGAALDEKRKEQFSNGGQYAPVNTETGRFIGMLVGRLVSLLILLFIGQFLWNNVAVKLVSVLKPAKSILEILGLVLLLALLR
jgi:tetrahydromethanopterin S-methyltransferase subunit G